MDRLRGLATFGSTLADAGELEDIVDVALRAIDEIFGFRHVLMMLRQTESDRLTTIASRGYDVIGIGSEVRIGEGVIGTVAASRQPMRIGNLQRMLAYVRTIRQMAEGGDAATSIALPGLANARSQLAAPMVAGGALLGVVAVESERAFAFDEHDQLVLTVISQLVAAALERAHLVETVETDTPDDLAAHVDAPPARAAQPERPPAHVRHYANDGSTFIDGEYVIKGVAGRLLWKLAGEQTTAGRRSHTNREARRDATLDMPSFRDNFESRLVLLKRRLEERDAPLRIHRTGRGRFDVEVLGPLRLERIDAP